MRVLVTGANGFLGSYVVEQLAERGHEPRLLMRAGSRVRYLQEGGFERVVGDLQQRESLAEAVKGVDGVIHLAGMLASLSQERYHAVNVQGSADLAQAAATAGVERFVYCSSLAAQGPNWDGAPPDFASARPVSEYGRSKLGGEGAVLAERERMHVSIVRPPVVYGPRDRGLLPFYKFARFGVLPVYGDGSNRLTWIHARDAAGAIVAALERSPASGSVYTACDGAIHTWKQLAAELGDAFGKRLRVIGVPGPLFKAAGVWADFVSRVTRKPQLVSAEKVVEMSQRAWVCSNAKISEELGWQPAIDARTGIAETYAWYREHRWL